MPVPQILEEIVEVRFGTSNRGCAGGGRPDLSQVCRTDCRCAGASDFGEVIEVVL